MKETDNFYLSQQEPSRSCLLALRNLILEVDKNVSETQKWGMPCFMYRKKMFCFLWTDKKTNEPYILFVEGKYLDHPKLEQGNRSRMKILSIDPNKNIPVNTITLLLNDALNLYKNGTLKLK